jgi:hypothetical protein
LSSNGCAVPFIGTRVDRDGAGETVVTFEHLATGSWAYVETHDAQEAYALLTGKTRLIALSKFEIATGRTTEIRLPPR